MLFFAFLGILSLIFLPSLAQTNLTTTLCNARLPSGRGYIGVVHDLSNPDYIFLIGGYNGIATFNSVHRYNVLTDNIEEFGLGKK